MKTGRVMWLEQLKGVQIVLSILKIFKGLLGKTNKQKKLQLKKKSKMLVCDMTCT